MTDALRFEWVRIRTVRSTYWLVGLAVVLTGLVAWLVAYGSRDEALTPELTGVQLNGAVGLVPVPLTPVLVGLLGVLAVGHEYRHGTIRPTLTALPHRSALVAAKLIVVGAIAALTTVVSIAVNSVVLWVVRGDAPAIGSAPLPAALVGYLLLVVLWGVLGVAITLLLRSTVATIVVLLVIPLVLEPLIRGLSFIPELDWLKSVVPWRPFAAGARMAQTFDIDAATNQIVGAGTRILTRLEAGLLFGAFVAVVLAVGWALFERRDA